MIELRHVRKAYANTVPLEDVNVVINRGDVISVIGPSGTGKSTLLRCINMLSAPTSGQIFLDGEEITAKGYDLTKARKRMGMVFQSFNLFGHMTVMENVVKPQMFLLKRSREEATKKAEQLLTQVGMINYRDQFPEMLSGGQKQRAAIARTLAMDPDLILFDEPTSALDPAMTQEVQTVISDVARQGITMMIVTHNMEFAREIANRIFYMDEGGIYEDGTPDQVFDNPQKELTRKFILRLKSLEMGLTTHHDDIPELTARIDTFCHQNHIGQKMMNNMLTVWDELVLQLLLPRMPEKFDLSLNFEYIKNENAMTATVRYNGGVKDPFDSEDGELAGKLLRGKFGDMPVTLCSGEEKPYQYKITIRF